MPETLTLQEKILSLHSANPVWTWRDIQAELRRPSETVSYTETARPQFAAELKLFNLIVPAVATFEEMQAAELKKDFVEARLLEMFGAAQDKATVLALSIRIQNAFSEVQDSGSGAFNDPSFLSPTTQTASVTYGESWLEGNGLESPTKYEILALLATLEQGNPPSNVPRNET